MRPINHPLHGSPKTTSSSAWPICTPFGHPQKGHVHEFIPWRRWLQQHYIMICMRLLADFVCIYLFYIPRKRVVPFQWDPPHRNKTVAIIQKKKKCEHLVPSRTLHSSFATWSLTEKSNHIHFQPAAGWLAGGKDLPSNYMCMNKCTRIQAKEKHGQKNHLRYTFPTL